MRAVLVPQYPSSDVAIGNAIVAVAKSLVSGMPGIRVVGLDGDSSGRIDATHYTSGEIIPAMRVTASRAQLTKKLKVEKDEYLLNLTPVSAPEIAALSAVNGSMFDTPKLLNYLLYGPSETDDVRMHCAILAQWPCVFNSDYCRAQWLEAARSYLSGGEIRRIQGHSGVANIGIDCAAIDAAGVDVVRREHVVGHCGRIASTKGFDKTLEVVEKMSALLPDARLLATTYGRSSVQKLKELVELHPVIEPYYRLSREEYYRKLWEPTGFVCFSERESVGLAWMEKIYAGQVGLFWDRSWVSGVFPGYRLIFSKRSDIESAALVMLRTRDRMLPHMSGWREKIKDEWDAALVGARVQTVAERLFAVTEK